MTTETLLDKVDGSKQLFNEPDRAALPEPKVVADDKPGLMDTVGAGFKVNNSLSGLTYKAIQAMASREIDPEFFPEEELQAIDPERAKSLTDDQRNELLNATNRIHFDQMMVQYDEFAEAEGIIERAGLVQGTLAQIPAFITDPTALVAGAGALKIAKLGHSSYASTRLKAFVEGGSIATAESLISEAVLNELNTGRDYDLLYAAPLSFVLGGGLGQVGYNSMKRLTAAADAEAFRELAKASPTPEGAVKLNELADKAEEGARASDLVGEAVDRAIAQGELTDAVGYGRGDITMRGRLSQSGDPILRGHGDLIYGNKAGVKEKDDLLAQSKENASAVGAESLMELRIKNNIVSFRSELEAKLKQHGIPTRTTSKKFEEVMEAVDAHRLGVRSDDPVIQDIATVFDNVYSRELSDLQAKGVRSFEDIVPDSSYSPIIYGNKARQMITKYKGTDVFQRVVRESIAENMNYLTPEQLDEVAKHSVSNIANRLDSTDPQAFAAHVPFDARRMVNMLEEIEAERAGTVSKGLIDLMKDKIDGATVDRGRPSRAKRRGLALDMNAGIEVDGEFVRMIDFVETNGFIKYLDYTRQVSGHAAMAQKGIPDLDTYLQRIGDDVAKLQAAGKKKEAKILADHRENAGRIMRGISLEENAARAGNGLLRAARFLASSMQMGKLGITMINELITVMGRGGLRTIAKSMPEIHQAITSGGKKPNQSVLELAKLHQGATSELYRNPYKARVEESGERAAADGLLGAFAKGAENAAELAARGTLSFARPMDALVKRYIRVGLNNDWAAGKLSDARLLQAGVPKDMLPKIAADLKKYREGDNFNWPKWSKDNPDTFFEYNRAIDDMSTSFVQEVDKGSSIKSLEANAGIKTILQYRSYSINAMTKQLARNASLAASGDATAASYFVFAMAGAAAMRYVHKYETSLSKDDPERWRKENMSPEAMAIETLNHTPWLGILGEVGENVMTAFDPYADSLVERYAAGAPAISPIANIGKTVSAPLAAAVSDEVVITKEGAVDHATKLLPNVPGIRPSIQYLFD